MDREHLDFWRTTHVEWPMRSFSLKIVRGRRDDAHGPRMGRRQAESACRKLVYSMQPLRSRSRSGRGHRQGFGGAVHQGALGTRRRAAEHGPTSIWRAGRFVVCASGTSTQRERHRVAWHAWRPVRRD